MAVQEFFGMVSLRRSKASAPQNTQSTTSDPRLRCRKILDDQATVEISPRDTRLDKLKARYVELARQVVQLEAVQRSVINADMLELENKYDSSAKVTHQDRSGSATSKTVAAGHPPATIRRTVQQ